MEHLGDKFDLGRLVGVLLCEVHCQLEYATLPDGVRGSKDNGIPLEEGVTCRGCTDLLIGIVSLYFLQVS